MNREYALTILLSQFQPDSLSIRRIEHILKQKVNWYKVFEIAVKEQTAYHVFNNLIQYHYLWNLPGNLKSFWYTAYCGNIQKNQKLLANSKTMTAYLANYGVPVFPIKGIILLESVYTDIGVRVISDIDYIVSEECFLNLKKLMTNKDFRAIYYDDEDIIIKKDYKETNTVFFSNTTSSIILTHESYNFCYGIAENKKLFEYIIQGLSNPNKKDYHIAQVIFLYLSATDSWEGDYIKQDVKRYTLSKLIDIKIYKEKYFDSEMLEYFEELKRRFHLKNEFEDVEKALAYQKECVYLDNLIEVDIKKD